MHPACVPLDPRHGRGVLLIWKFSGDWMCFLTSACGPSQDNSGWQKTKVCCGWSCLALCHPILGQDSKEIQDLRIETADPLCHYESMLFQTENRKDIQQLVYNFSNSL